MSYPTYYISSSITNVDTETTSKIIMLPPAASIQGTPLYIRDWFGQASVNPIYVSTQQDDFMENTADTIVLNTDFQSLRVVPYDTTKYAITLNYTQGLNPYEYAIQISMFFRQTGFVRNWSAVSMSENSDFLLAVTNGGSSQGFYSSTDGGVTWAYTARTGNFSDCVIGLNTWYVAEYGGVIYKSSDQGASWEPCDLRFGNQDYIAIDCDNNGGSVIAITSLAVFSSNDNGTNFENRSFLLPLGVTLTDVACAGNFSASYISATESISGSRIYQTLDKTAANWSEVGDPGQWTGITADDSGFTAYVTSSVTGMIYKTSDKGSTWVFLPGQPYGYCKPLCSWDGTTMYGLDVAGTQLYQTLDGGTTFTAVGPSRTWVAQYGANQTALDIFIPESTQYLYVGQTHIL